MYMGNKETQDIIREDIEKRRMIGVDFANGEDELTVTMIIGKQMLIIPQPFSKLIWELMNK